MVDGEYSRPTITATLMLHAVFSQTNKMSKRKKEKFDPDNILGWQESDFEEIKAAMVNARFHGNLPIEPQLLRDYCSFDDKVKFKFLNDDR